MWCEHANEVAKGACTCNLDCACRSTMCNREMGSFANSRSQPAPQPNESINVKDLVEQDFHERVQFGKVKYGTYLKVDDGRDPLVDLYQELWDAIMYTRKALYQKYDR